MGIGRRRIRTQSILLSSYRQRPNAWDNWLKWEIAKGFIPAIAMMVVHASGWIAIPAWLAALTIIGAGAWMIFVVFHAWDAFRRMDQRRLARLKAAGVTCDLSRGLWSSRAWKASLGGKTMHEVLHDPSFKNLAGPGSGA